MADREVKNWVTINGNHVPIYEGESTQDAFNRSVAMYNENKKDTQIKKAKEQADKLNKKFVNPYYERANEVWKSVPINKGDLTFEKALGEYSNYRYFYNDYISEELSHRGGTPKKDLYRGMYFRAFDPTSTDTPYYEKQFKNAKVGDVISSDRLSSFSVIEDVAKKFALSNLSPDDLYDGKYASVMIHLIDNTKAMDVSPYSTSFTEAEYLAPKNVKYKIVKVYNKGYVKYLDVVEV